MKEHKDVISYLREEGNKIEIPDSITPEQIRKRLEQIEKDREAEQKEAENVDFESIKKNEDLREKGKQRKSQFLFHHRHGYYLSFPAQPVLHGRNPQGNPQRRMLQIHILTIFHMSILALLLALVLSIPIPYPNQFRYRTTP